MGKTLTEQGSTPLQFSWEIPPSRLKICSRPDGSDFKLGSGGFGTVFKAVLDDIQPVALKVLNLDSNDGGPSRSQLAKFEEEINVMRACHFQNVVSFLGSWVDHNTVGCRHSFGCVIRSMAAWDSQLSCLM